MADNLMKDSMIHTILQRVHVVLGNGGEGYTTVNIDLLQLGA